MRTILILVLAILLPLDSPGQSWPQWGRTSRHDSTSPVIGHWLDRIEASVVIDPFAQAEKATANGNLLVHYQVPLVDGDDLFLVLKSGAYTGRTTRETQIWNVRLMHRQEAGGLVERWLFPSDWKPVPSGGPGPSWEPVYHCALAGDSVWAPGAGGTMLRIRRSDGVLLQRINPFGFSVDPTIFVTGPPTVDADSNIFYNAIKLNLIDPWGSNVVDSWLVRISPNGSVTMATFTSLTPNAPGGFSQCMSQFPTSQLPFPPAPDAVAPTIVCGSQRPGINVAPAVADDGTIYTISRAHFTDRWGYLVAVNRDMTPKWTASLRNRFSDGCNVTIPPNGTPGGCREGATTGVDPADNQLGSGRVSDESTSSPVVAPDGSVLYGALSRYNYAQGHLMKFASNGSYLGAYGWGWDLTPAIYEHEGTYSIALKENHYGAGSYCNDPLLCPPERTIVTPHDPEQYFITQIDASLRVEWKFKNDSTASCVRDDSGNLQCVEDHPNGFEWCVNAIAIDANGVVYANSEDGHLYSISQGGSFRQKIFLQAALGAAYTPLSIGNDGRIYTQNDGELFIVEQRSARRRAVRRSGPRP